MYKLHCQRLAVYEVLAYFVANTVAHVHRQAGQVRSSTACVAVFMTRVADQLFALSRGFCNAC